ncbi:MAG: PAS domain S-box protein [Oscillochloridaceae bacterium]|nr:PAS domain S-box protein [Chloroflexaceae bacterium]MDW8390052.1 PAS domain S-box protein [Oscillochloridaceae bacterium]
MKWSVTRVPMAATSPFWMALSLATLALVALADAITPLMRAPAALYVLPILIAIFARRAPFVIAVAVLGTLLCIASYALAPLPEEWSAYALINPGSAVGGMLAAAGLGLALLRVMERNEEQQRVVQQQYELLRMASTAGRLGGWIAYLPNGPVRWTDEVAQIYELDPASPPETLDFERFIAPEHLERMRACFERCAREGTPYDEEFEIITTGGRRLWVSTFGRAVRDASGKIVAVHGAVQDISRAKEIEASLARSEARFRQFAESVPLIVWTNDVAGKLDYINQAIAELCGPGAPVQALGDGWLTLLHPDDVDAARAACEQGVRAGMPSETEFRFRTRDGSYRWHLARAFPVRDEQGNVIKWYGAATNIDEQKRLATRLRTILESVTDGFVIIDPDGRIAYMNTHAEHILLRSRADLLGKSIYETFPQIRGTRFDREYSQARATGRAAHFEEFFPRRGIWLEFSLYPSEEGVAVYFRDVTRRRQMEDQLRLLETAVARLNDIVMITEARPIDEPGPRIIFVNDAFERITGYRPDEVLGRSPRILQGPRSQRSELDRVRVALEQCEFIVVRVINYRKSGEEFWNEFSIIPITDEQGNCTHFVSIQRDVTEQVKLEEQLRQSQRLEAVGQLTGGVAHDFNNLLTVMLGNAELLSEALAGNPDLKMLAEMIGAAAQRGSELTQHLLAFARRQALDPRAVDVNRLVTGMDGLIRRALGEHIAIQAILAPDLWPALVDPAQLESALLNLCINARDAMPTGGALTIETANVLLDQQYAERATEVTPGPYVLIAVSDTGVGIAPEHLPHVFEPFFTTKEKGKGSGLGLSMVYGFIKQSRGHVTIYSEPGRGTTVKLYLPRAVETVAGYQPGIERTWTGGNETILLVEDDEAVRNFARQQLTSLGYRVLEAGSGPEALEIVRAHDDIDLIFTDIVMPGGMSGRELVEAARQVRPGIKALYTSGYAENVIVHHGRLDPGVVLLSKPYRRMDLARKVREALATGAESRGDGEKSI